MLKSLKKILKQLKGNHSKNDYQKNYSKKRKRAIHFKSISKISKTPSNNSIRTGDFIVVFHKNQPIWVLFKCPCGCQYVISLSLQGQHNPHWILRESDEGLPTLYPSIWQSIGCHSHFWITEGKVKWCDNTGLAPWLAYNDD